VTRASWMKDGARTAVLASASLAMLACATVTHAQTSGSAGAAPFQSGYGGARYTTSQAQTGSTRDANGNRVIIDGIIQAGASSYSRQSSGAASAYSGSGAPTGHGLTVGGATAIGNSLNVVVQGNRNIVIVNSRQTNNGNITAGTVLNGTLDLND